MRTHVLALCVSAATVAVVLAACSGDNSAVGGGGDGGSDSPGMNDGSVESGGDDAGEAGTDAPGEAANDAGSDAPPGTSFCDGTIGALVTAFESCCSAQDKTTQDYMLIDAVLQTFKSDCETQLQTSVTKGRATIDATLASQCEQEIQMLAGQGFCWGALDNNKQSGPVFGSPPCNGVVTGLVDSGQPCAADYECKAGLACVGWTNSSDGTCQTPGGAGGACGYAADAGSVTVIDFGFGNHPDCAAGNWCAGSTCMAQGGSGATCTQDLECQSGLACHLGKCGTGSPSGAGGPCVDKYDCQAGLYCAKPDGGPAGTCAAREGTGGACEAYGDECKGYCAVPDGGSAGTCAAICGSG